MLMTRAREYTAACHAMTFVARRGSGGRGAGSLRNGSFGTLFNTLMKRATSAAGSGESTAPPRHVVRVHLQRVAARTRRTVRECFMSPKRITVAALVLFRLYAFRGVAAQARKTR